MPLARNTILAVLLGFGAGRAALAASATAPARPAPSDAWVTRTVEALGSLTHGAVAAQLARQQRLFTKAGWTSWRQTLRNSGDLELVRSSSTAIETTVTKAPTLVRTTKRGGRIAWVYTMPIAVKVNGSGQNLMMQENARLTVLAKPGGYAVQALVEIPG